MNFYDCYSILDSPEAQEALRKEHDIILRIRQMENDKLTQWKKEVTKIIHSSTSKFLLKRSEEGLLDMNFDDDVSITVGDSLCKLLFYFILCNFYNGISKECVWPFMLFCFCHFPIFE